MALVRVAAVTLNQTPLDWEGNRDNLLAGLEEARAAGAAVVCFPELCLSGYGCEDAFLWPETAETAQRILAEIAPQTQGLVASVGLPLAFEESVYNCVALLVDGKLVGIVAKRHLAGEGLHYEPRWFAPWPRGVHRHVLVCGVRVPLGDLVFEVGGIRLGFEICEDAWVEERPGFELARAGASLILNPSASHFAFGKHSVRRRIVLAGAREFQAAYVYCNLLGNEAGRAIYDGDAIIAVPSQTEGRGEATVVAEARRLSFTPRALVCATLELARVVPADAPTGRLLVKHNFAFPAEAPKDVLSERTPGADAEGELPKEEAVARVIALGLFDYMRKSRSQGFVVSLSGGADSAAVAILVRLMVRLGVAELGLEAFLDRSGCAFKDAPLAEEELVSSILWTVYQGTENSSETTRRAAQEVATFLGARHAEISVEPLVASYRALAEEVIKRPLTWETDDIALQNIQARVRAPSVWMLANVGGKLLLSTSNRSEAAVGYATMDGDTAGGLCPIGGVDKAFLKRWLSFMQVQGLSESGPMPVLHFVLSQEPTAELRPPAAVQSDEVDLMPYDVLEAIERRAVILRRSPKEVQREVEAAFPHYDPEEILGWVRKFYRLFAQNQWKRERYAPSFHVDDANLDPKTWCRFPILSGGFRYEMSRLTASDTSSK